MQSHKVNSFQDSITSKNNENNDLKIKLITFEKQVGVLENQVKDLKAEYEIVKRENQVLKAKLLEGGQGINMNY